MKPVRDHLVDHDGRLRGQHILNDGREEPYPHQQQERPYGEMEPEGGARGEARLHERQLRRQAPAEGGHPRVCAYPAHQPSSPSRWRISQRPSQMNATSQSEQEGQEYIRADQDGVCIYREKSVWYQHVRHRRDSGDASLSART